jgi:hypothetical protein
MDGRLDAMIARNKRPLRIESGLNPGSTGQNRRNVVRVLVSYRTFSRGWAFRPNIIIDYATARRREEPISTAITDSTVQWLLHRRMNAQQQMRWSPRSADLMLKVRTSVVNGHARPGLCRRGALGAPPVSASGLTPHILDGLMRTRKHFR